MNDISNLRDTILPKSDQLNAEMLIPGPMTVTVTGVTRGNDEQPVVIHYANDAGKPYKPCKSMRKVLVFAWGEDGRDWVGRSMTLYHDPEVVFGGVKVGGIRISHLSHIERDIGLSLTATKGKKKQFVIGKLEAPAAPVADPAEIESIEKAASKGMAVLQQTWASISHNTKKVLGKPGLDRLKEIAQRADQQPSAEPEPAPEPEPASEPDPSDDDPF